MSPRSETLADAIGEAMPLFERFLKGFGDANRTKQAPGLPNHAAWTLGHLGLVANRGAERVAGYEDPQPLPAEDFGAPGPTKFDPESVAIGSSPVDDPEQYPSWERGLAIYSGAYKRLVHAVRHASDEDLQRSVSWGSGTLTVEALIVRLIVHLGTHAGQIVDLRRALGFEPLIK